MASVGMRAKVSRGIVIDVHQQGAVEPLTTAHEFELPHSGQTEGSTVQS